MARNQRNHAAVICDSSVLVPRKLKFSKWLASASTRTHSAAIIFMETSHGSSMAAAFAMVQMPPLSFQALQRSPCVLLLVLCIRSPSAVTLAGRLKQSGPRRQGVLFFPVCNLSWMEVFLSPIFNRIVCLEERKAALASLHLFARCCPSVEAGR